MEKERKIRRIIVFSALTVLAMLGIFAGIAIGNVSISFKEALLVLTGQGAGKNAAIITDIRLPRVLMTFILGGGLAVSGFLLQTYFANPIAGPYILGISSGAKMAVALMLIFIVGSTGRTSSMMLNKNQDSRCPFLVPNPRGKAVGYL